MNIKEGIRSSDSPDQSNAVEMATMSNSEIVFIPPFLPNDFVLCIEILLMLQNIISQACTRTWQAGTAGYFI